MPDRAIFAGLLLAALAGCGGSPVARSDGGMDAAVDAAVPDASADAIDDATSRGDATSSACADACAPGTRCTVASAALTGTCEPSSCAGQPDGTACAFGVYNGSTDSYQGSCCGGQCVDPNQDVDNCGGCGDACPQPAVCSMGFCIEGAGATSDGCGAGCPSGFQCVHGACALEQCTLEGTYCAANGVQGGSCCPDFDGNIQCVDVFNDPMNCGGCRFICPAGQTCDNGQCSGATAPCGSGSVRRWCAPTDATSTQVCCLGTGCTDLETDPQNCGGCGFVCEHGEQCVGGECTLVGGCTADTQFATCPSPDGGLGTWVCCNASCVDFDSDHDNCGGCGRACGAGEICSGGFCALAG